MGGVVVGTSAVVPAEVLSRPSGGHRPARNTAQTWNSTAQHNNRFRVVPSRPQPEAACLLKAPRPRGVAIKQHAQISTAQSADLFKVTVPSRRCSCPCRRARCAVQGLTNSNTQTYPLACQSSEKRKLGDGSHTQSGMQPGGLHTHPYTYTPFCRGALALAVASRCLGHETTQYENTHLHLLTHIRTFVVSLLAGVKSQRSVPCM